MPSNYYLFSGYADLMPEDIVPRTTWGAGAVSTTCFDDTVAMPTLWVGSLGSWNTPVHLTFSDSFNLVYDAGGTTVNGPTTLSFNGGPMTGVDGANFVIEFTGNHQCISMT